MGKKSKRQDAGGMAPFTSVYPGIYLVQITYLHEQGFLVEDIEGGNTGVDQHCHSSHRVQRWRWLRPS